MKLKHAITGGFLAAALFGMASVSAKAQSLTPPYADGDWLLGFYSNLQGNEYVIDLGAHSASTSFTLLNSVSHIATDLSTAFGSGWYGQAKLYYGVAETNGANGNAVTVLLSNPNATPWSNTTNVAQAETGIQGIGSNVGGQFQTSGEASTGLISAIPTGNSDWSYYANPSGGGSPGFGLFTNTGGDTVFSALTNSSIGYDQIINSPTGKSTQVGTFSLDSAGDVTYTAAAVPEPSTFAAIGMGAAVLAFARRRRS